MPQIQQRIFLIMTAVLPATELLVAATPAAEPTVQRQFGSGFTREILPVVTRYCLDCHSTEKAKGELDLERFTSIDQVRGDLATWQSVAEMLKSRQMPPEEAHQPSPAQHQRLVEWVTRLLDIEARARAGDPGRVLLRRLSNAEYKYTMRDLIGIDLDPAREFPVDGAAGEGFTNTGQSLVMSPSLLEKYFDAANQIADHAALLPQGFQFFKSDKRPDWTRGLVTAIRELYDRYAEGGRLPLARYISTTVKHRKNADFDSGSLEKMASERELSLKYLRTVWQALNDPRPSILYDTIRSRWKTLAPDEADQLVVDIEKWNRELWHFTNVSLFEKWLVPNNNLSDSRTIRHVIRPSATLGEPVLYLQSLKVGDQSQPAYVRWKHPRFEAEGQEPLFLRDIITVANRLRSLHHRGLANTTKYLAAVTELRTGKSNLSEKSLADKYGLDANLLDGWIDYLNSDVGKLDPGHNYLPHRLSNLNGKQLVGGWTSDDGPLLLTNAADEPRRLEQSVVSGFQMPGVTLPSRSVVVHPVPGRPVSIGWASPMKEKGRIRVEFKVSDAQPGVGSGIAWSIQANILDTPDNPLPSGVLEDGQQVTINPIQWVRIQPGEIIALVIEACGNDTQGNLTQVEMIVHETDRSQRKWSLSHDLTRNSASGNPHPDRTGIANVWHLIHGRDFTNHEVKTVVPAGSLLDQWKTAAADPLRHKELGDIANQVQTMLLTTAPLVSSDDPNLLLYRQLVSLDGPLLKFVDEQELVDVDDTSSDPKMVAVPLYRPGSSLPDQAIFGHPLTGGETDQHSLVVTAPGVLELRVPAKLVAGREFVVEGSLDPTSSCEASVQCQLATPTPGQPTGPRLQVDPVPGVPILTANDSPARTKLAESIAAFRHDFPPTVCYRQIIPISGDVTVTLMHREDEHLRRLVLTEEETQELDALWAKLRYVSREPLKLQEGFDVVAEITGGSPALRKRIRERAEQFKKEIVDSEPSHLEALVKFAARAYRQPLSDGETAKLLDLYQAMRTQQQPHDVAFRTVLSRILISPRFLYRVEKPATGETAEPVSDFELASRLSYFLWSTMPDEELLDVTHQGNLHDRNVLLSQARRLLTDQRVRGLAVEFAAQWLHVRGFDEHDEKNGELFPTYNASLREAMYEETLLFFEGLFRQDRSVMEILEANYTYLNPLLAEHYGIPDVTGPQWRRVERVDEYARGGILAMGSVLSKQAGASRTSPVLRGTWIVETVLGERLPKPPANVPELPDAETDTGNMTVRQLVEKHTSVEECAACHEKFDPYGFSLENFDAIGRYRRKDHADRPLDTHVELPDGIQFQGLDGLRNYLLIDRKIQFLQNFCEKLLGYALGRSVILSDQPLVEKMVSELEKTNYRFSSAIECIITSRQFQYHRGVDSVSH
jgi:hypothetical protein